MPFGLKNVRAIYQHTMSAIFFDYLCKTVECYVYDITSRSRSKEDHLHDLRPIFDIMQSHQLKVNPTKSFLGASSGKFLEFAPCSIQGPHHSRDASFEKSQKAPWFVRDSFTSGGSLSIYMEMSAFVETDEEKHSVFFGQCMSADF